MNYYRMTSSIWKMTYNEYKNKENIMSRRSYDDTHTMNFLMFISMYIHMHTIT